MKTKFPIFLTVACLVGCGPEIGVGEVEDLRQAGAVILATSGVGEVPSARWPSAISRVDPERVYVTTDGLYVVTSSLFVEEQGLFVPREADFMPQGDDDPSYESLREGVFSYRIKG